jgi:hypothetical protein
MSFDDAAVRDLMSRVTSHAGTLGVFRRVNSHEPKSAPGNGLTYACWVQAIEPLGQASGLDSTTGYVVLLGRIYGSMLQKPEDDVDPRILSAATTLIGAYTGDFDFGETVRNVDLLGMYGQKLRAQAGYARIGESTYRIMDITIPVVINDMWKQVA